MAIEALHIDVITGAMTTLINPNFYVVVFLVFSSDVFVKEASFDVHYGRRPVIMSLLDRAKTVYMFEPLKLSPRFCASVPRKRRVCDRVM